MREQLDRIARLEATLPRDKAAVSQARAVLRGMITQQDRERQQELRRELTAALRKIDDEEAEALRNRVQELFDYPIFMAEARSAGITSTGETGQGVPNELPDIAEAFHQFLANPQAFEGEALEQQSDEAVA